MSEWHRYHQGDQVCMKRAQITMCESLSCPTRRVVSLSIEVEDEDEDEVEDTPDAAPLRSMSECLTVDP